MESNRGFQSLYPTRVPKTDLPWIQVKGRSSFCRDESGNLLDLRFSIKTVAINVAFFAGYVFCIQKIESHIPTLGWVTNTVVDSHGRLGFIYHIMVYLDAKEMQTKTCPAGISVLSPAFSRTVWRIEQR